MEIIEYDSKYDEQIKDLLVELQEYLIKIDDWKTQVLYKNYRDEYFNLDMKKVNENSGKIYLAKEGNSVVGLVIGIINEIDEVDKITNDCKLIGNVLELIVNENVRGKNIGKKLLYKIEEYFKKLQCKRITIEVFGPNKNAYEFYKRCGYVVRDRFVSKKVLDDSLNDNYKIVEITDKFRGLVNEILKEEWESTNIIIRGQVIDGNKLDGFIYLDEKNEIKGVITYLIYQNNEIEIVSLNSFMQNIGIGTKLIDKVKQIAKEKSCKVIKLVTTNDNVNALKFYQKRGFYISNVYLNAVEKSRKLKPQIPLYADNGIMIRDEIELIMNLN